MPAVTGIMVAFPPFVWNNARRFVGQFYADGLSKTEEFCKALERFLLLWQSHCYFVKRHVNPDEIKVTENPDETGSFFVGLQCERFVLSPNGEIAADRLHLLR